MDNLFNVIGLLTALAILLAIAFPHHIFPERDPKKKKVGSCYWGVYEGQETEEPEEKKTIEVEKPSRKMKVVAGSIMYAKGRGTSFRQ